MNRVLLSFAVLATVTTASTAQEATCQGPFAACARQVRAWCERDNDGEQRMVYKANAVNAARSIELCIGGIYESKGIPNPFKTGQVPDSEELPFPRLEAREMLECGC
jgi:hypothetical protein